MPKCPDCGTVMVSRSCQACGYGSSDKTERPVDPKRWFCCYEELGERCANLGTLAEGTHGFAGNDGNERERWFCHQHFPPFRERNRGKPTAPPTGWRDSLPDKLRRIDYEALAERAAIESGQ